MLHGILLHKGDVLVKQVVLDLEIFIPTTLPSRAPELTPTRSHPFSSPPHPTHSTKTSLDS